MFYATNEKIIHQMNQIWNEELMLGGVKKEIWIKSVSNKENITLKLLYQKKGNIIVLAMFYNLIASKCM